MRTILRLVLASCVIMGASGTNAWCGYSCPVQHQTLGCYQDDVGNRLLPDYIYQERDAKLTKNYGGRKIDWSDWSNYMPGFICRCAEKAKELGYDIFGVQFYGECWAGKSDKNQHDMLGASSDCIGGKFTKCTPRDRYCAGGRRTNMVYRIVDTSCPDAPFEKVGCFHDRYHLPRLLPSYILNDRDPGHKHFSGKMVDWRNWDVYVPDLACRCAKKAKELGWNFFGLQYYGECWSGDGGQDTYFLNEKATQCTDKCYRRCTTESELCVGNRFTNFVYKLKGPCELDISPVGCYKEARRGRALSREIYNEIDPKSKVFAGKILDVNDWAGNFPEFLCKCARRAKEIGQEYFGVQNQGGCWSDSSAAGRFNTHGPSDQCFEGEPGKPCDPNRKLCAGFDLNNFVYRVRLSDEQSDASDADNSK